MNLSEYKQAYPRLKNRLTSLEKRTTIAEQLLDIKESPGMRLLGEELNKIVQSINEKLLSGDAMEGGERENLLTDRDRCMWLADLFGVQEQIINSTIKYLEKLKV